LNLPTILDGLAAISAGKPVFLDDKTVVGVP
jgi:hypothetical protein